MPPQRSNPRELFLSATLSLLLGGVIVGFLVVICGGFAVYFLIVLLGLFGVGLLHYVLWGHAFSAEVAGEREEEDSADRPAEANGTLRDNSPSSRF